MRGKKLRNYVIVMVRIVEFSCKFVLFLWLWFILGFSFVFKFKFLVILVMNKGVFYSLV